MACKYFRDKELKADCSEHAEWMVYIHANFEGLIAGVSYQSHMPHVVYRLVYQDLIVPTSFGNLCNCELLNRKTCECRGPIGYASDCCLNCGREKCTDVLICTSNNVPSNYPDDDAYIGECHTYDCKKVFHCEFPVMDFGDDQVTESFMVTTRVRKGSSAEQLDFYLLLSHYGVISNRNTVGLLIVHQRIRDLIPGRPTDWRDVSLAFPMALCRPPEVGSNQSHDLDSFLGCEPH